MEKNAPNVVVVDAAGRAILSAVLASGGPKISLGVERVSGQILMLNCVQRAYMIHERIGCDIVIAGQFGQSQALATFGRGRGVARSLWRHSEFGKLETTRDCEKEEVSWNAARCKGNCVVERTGDPQGGSDPSKVGSSEKK